MRLPGHAGPLRRPLPLAARRRPPTTTCPACPRAPTPTQGFNEQLQKSAFQLSAVGRCTDLDEPEWDLLDRQMRYGTNEMAIPVASMPSLIFAEMWHPFYVFQYFAVLVGGRAGFALRRVCVLRSAVPGAGGVQVARLAQLA
jgi:hypothetical protein